MLSNAKHLRRLYRLAVKSVRRSFTSFRTTKLLKCAEMSGDKNQRICRLLLVFFESVPLLSLGIFLLVGFGQEHFQRAGIELGFAVKRTVDHQYFAGLGVLRSADYLVKIEHGLGCQSFGVGKPTLEMYRPVAGTERIITHNMYLRESRNESTGQAFPSSGGRWQLRQQLTDEGHSK